MKLPVTPAIRSLRSAKVPFEGHLYSYVERGGSRRSADVLGIDEHRIIKTLVFEDDAKKPLIVLMHGDRQVSTKQLARRLNVRRITPCDPRIAQRHTGYQVGGTSPFGTRKALPIYIEETLLALDRVVINGGKRGFLIELATADLVQVLGPTAVQVAI